MINDEERNTDVSVSISTDTTAEAKKSKKNEPKFGTINQQQKSTACAEWKPPECLCHAYRITPCIPPNSTYRTSPEKPRNFSWKWPRRASTAKRSEKPYLKSEILRGIPRQKPTIPTTQNFTSEADELARKIGKFTEKIEIYYFDHGNSAYYRTTDAPPLLTTERYADKTDQAATRFWAEIFGTIHIGITFLIAFVLQLLRFILYSLIRPLTIGIIQLVADYFVKPFLTILFNALIQPVLILLYNIATSLRDLCEPIAEAVGFFVRELARLFQAVRLVEVNRNVYNGNIPT